MPVGTIWLVAHGQWWALAAPAVVWFVAPWVIAIALLPGLGLAAAAAKIASRRRLPAAALAIVGLVYVATVITAWCMGVFTAVIEQSRNVSAAPLLLLIFAVAVLPWRVIAYRALREKRRGEVIQTFYLEIGTLLVILTYAIVRSVQLATLWWLFAAVMLVEVAMYISPMFFTTPPTESAAEAGD